MFSGDPNPAQDLEMILQAKRAQPGLNCEVVCDAARWIKAQLKGARVPFTYFSCDDKNYYGYSVFFIQITGEARHSSLEIKLLEIDGRAHAFCKVKVISGKGEDVFTYFTEISGEDGRRILLAYTADFLLSAGHI